MIHRTETINTNKLKQRGYRVFYSTLEATYYYNTKKSISVTVNLSTGAASLIKNHFDK